MSSIKSIALAKMVGGGGEPGDITVQTLNVNANGKYTAPSGKAYSPVNVSVANSYAAGDEGKVVQNGALVAQTGQSVTANGTYDTTTNDEVVVNVSSAGGTIYCHQCILSGGSDRAAISIATDSSDSFTLDSLIEWLSDHGYNSSRNRYPAYGLLNGSSSDGNTVIGAYIDGSYVRLISKTSGSSANIWSVTDTVVQN